MLFILLLFISQKGAYILYYISQTMNPKLTKIKKNLQLLQQEYQHTTPKKQPNISYCKTKQKQKQRKDEQTNNKQESSQKEEKKVQVKVKKLNKKQKMQIVDDDQFQYCKDIVYHHLVQDAQKWKNDGRGRQVAGMGECMVGEIEGVDGLREYKQIKYMQHENPNIEAPSKPLGPYILFLKQRKRLERQAKLEQSHSTAPKSNNQMPVQKEWQNLTTLQKDKYYVQYENMLHKYNILNQQYKLISGKKKVLTAYIRFYRKMYGMLQVECQYTSIQITKIIKHKWSAMTDQEKEEYFREQIEDKFQIIEMRMNLPDKIITYNQKLKQYQSQMKALCSDGSEQVGCSLFQIKKKREQESKMKKLQRKQENQRQKKEKQRLQRKRMQEIRNRLMELKEKQIMKLKMQNYEMNGYPKSYFQTPQKCNKQQPPTSTKLGKSATCITKNSLENMEQSQQSESIELEVEQGQDRVWKNGDDMPVKTGRKREEEEVESYEQELQELESKTKRIKKDGRQVVRKPGISVFKKIVSQMQDIFGFN